MGLTFGRKNDPRAVYGLLSTEALTVAVRQAERTPMWARTPEESRRLRAMKAVLRRRNHDTVAE